MKNQFSLALVLALFLACVSLHAQYEKRINCGDSSPADYQGETFDADSPDGIVYDYVGEVKQTEGHGSFTLNDGASPSIFDYTRYTKGSSMQYIFYAPDGDYTVKLHYAEPFHGPDLFGTSQDYRLFDIEINGTLVQDDFCAYCEAGGANLAITKTYNITVSGGSGLTLDFKEVYIGSVEKNDPMVQAIEVLEQSSGSPDNQAPTVPSNVSASYGSGTATIDWTASTDASGILRYDIQASQDGGAYSTIGTSATNQFITSSLAANSTYTFQVRAVDNSANQNPSAYSNPSNSIDTGGTAPPTGTVWSESGSNIYYNSGNVGVGTTAPTGKLHIMDSGTLGGMWQPENSYLTISDNNNSLILDTNEIYGSGTLFIGSRGADIVKFRSVTESTATDRMVIKDNGNVGIGTDTPDAPLAVNGRIHAKEVLVDLIGWPDYVFEEAYELPTLEEVEKHINEKGHLINIPSAEEVEANGIRLGEMNKLLLEKIEELTLYILQQEERIKVLESAQLNGK